MAHEGTPHRLVVVCDGAKALLLADAGIAPEPRLSVMETLEEPHETTRALGTERPGRVHQSNGPARSAVEQTDFHAQEEAAFLNRLAERLSALVGERAIARILLVAPPRALGTLRDALSAPVRALVSGEIAKDLVKMPVNEIERHIAA